MLVEINLLPKKEPKSKFLLMLVILLIVIIILGFAVVLYLGKSYDNKIESTVKQIRNTQNGIAQLQQQIVDYEESNSVVELQNTVKWASTYPIKTVPLLNHLTELLPERGFIKTFAYEEKGEVTLSIQFDQSRESAYYLNSLNESNWIKNAMIESLTTTTGFYKIIEGFDDDRIPNEKYIPRYLAEYKIVLNKEKIKEEEAKEKLNPSDDTSDQEETEASE